MIGLLPILARWRLGLGLAAALALLGLIGALSHYRHAYNAEKALRADDRALYVQAQADALRRAQDALRQQEHIYMFKARESDHEYQNKIADARSLADRYIAAHRVRGQAVAGSGGGTVASAEDRGAGRADSAGQTPLMVAVTDADIQVCTDNTTRLDAARAWALGLHIAQ